MLQYHQNFPQYINHGFTQTCTCSVQSQPNFRLQNSAASQDDTESSTILLEISWLWCHAILNVNRECVAVNQIQECLFHNVALLLYMTKYHCTFYCLNISCSLSHINQATR